MRLTLEVKGQEAIALAAGCRKEFGTDGGTIGRLPDNDWVLPNPWVSSRHARIVYANGGFQVEDTSRNGTSVNDIRLDRGKRYPLTSGDRIRIDPFEIDVSVTTDSQASSGHRPQSSGGLSDADDLSLSELLGPGPQPIRSGPLPNDPRAGSLLNDPYTPPPLPLSHAEAVTSAEDYDPWPDVPQPPTPAPFAPKPAERPAADPVPAPAARPADDGAGTVSLAAVLEGAGLTGADVTADLARDLGAILRVVVSGVIDVLKARQKIKDEFRLPGTIYQRENNNPLKFSADASHALQQLLVHRHKANLGPVEAFEDAFDDIRHHQMAMLAGVRVAFEAMLERFDPERLEEAFDRQIKKGSLLPVPAKLRYWELYRETVRDMVSDADRSFRTLFGDDFGAAYEEQLGRLKARARQEPR
jgi:type VI secretion system FHA domain protein